MSAKIYTTAELLIQNSSQIEFWVSRYEKKATEWYIDQVNPHLQKYISYLDKGPKKIFVPLCGKTKDIPYLLSLGFEVFGIEGIKKVIWELDSENELGLTYNEINSVYETKDGRLKIYCGDLFKCAIESFGPFDCVWDRGSFIAIDESSRQLYSDLMRRSVSKSDHKFNYLLQTARYDKINFSGPPNCVTEEDMNKFFSWTSYQKLEDEIVPDNSPMRKVSSNSDPNTREIIYHITNLH